MIYHSLGDLPPKRHIQFRRPDGELHSEELFGAEGFSGSSSLLYHYYPPTRVTKVEQGPEIVPERWETGVLRHHHLRTKDIPVSGDPVSSRIPVLYNSDVLLSVGRPNEPMDYFYRNGEHDELVFIHEGKGVVRSSFGTLPFAPWDYVYIPRGTTYRMDFDTEDNRIFVVESSGPISIPRRYRSELGQFMENSPFCERDIGRPQLPLFYDETGEFEVRIKKLGRMHRYWFDHHPLDTVGWDGYLYPWTFNIKNFEPITGRVHQPPPVHQTFAGPNFVVCSFVPRLFDYHPLAIPAPYVHSNIDSDEVLYYVHGDFMSRRGVEYASITEHPGGIPHGPHPGKAEESIGKVETHEYAVMVDTFHPLFLAKDAEDLDDPKYPYSWQDVDATAHR
jgi:homogentisate 1,2-dioxygenase